MTNIFASQALTNDGWTENVRIVTEGERIRSLTTDATAEADDIVAGIVIPGLANVHSHAFQRAMAGHTEKLGPSGKDNFWSWRERMYALAVEVDAKSLHAIARQAYAEMLATGFTSVVEFHYLHSEEEDRGGADAMYEAIAQAASDVGIRLTFVPILYERAGFTAHEPTEAQRKFARSVDQLVAQYQTIRGATSGPAMGRFQVGLGVHSLRAVSENSLTAIAALAKEDRVPMHLHIAEQSREVEECVAVLGARPVEWLFDRCDVDPSWCLVHATHINDDEITAIAKSGAVVGLCPSTEANLGDGLFPLKRFLELGGQIGIGSDSHVSINPFEELRWLEYGQRLVTQSRNVAAISRSHTGRSLFEAALTGGAQAAGRVSDRLADGSYADLIVLDDDNPMLAGHTSESFLDALVFSGFSLPIDRVMVNGQWQVVDGRLQDEEPIQAAYLQAVQTLQRKVAT